jgi:hypothetical protein
MSSILKKLMAFAILLIAAGHLKAQVPGSAPVKNGHPVMAPQTGKLHSHSWHKEELLKRYPQYSAQVSKQVSLSGRPATQSPPTLAQLRQYLLQQYPQLQQRAMIPAQSRNLSAANNVQAAQRAFVFYREEALKQIEKTRRQAELIRQQSLQTQQPIQQSPVNQ